MVLTVKMVKMKFLSFRLDNIFYMFHVFSEKNLATHKYDLTDFRNDLRILCE